MDPRLDAHRRKWEEKAVLRVVYTDIYRRMVASLVPGPTLEIGGGFRSWSLIPAGAVRSLLRLEDSLLPFLGPLMAFRMPVVLERT